MKKIIKNLVLLNILALPCILAFNDVNQDTREWNYTINLIDIVYSVWFYNCVLKPIFKPYVRKEDQ